MPFVLAADAAKALYLFKVFCVILMAQNFFQGNLDCVEYNDKCINSRVSMSMAFQYPYSFYALR